MIAHPSADGAISALADMTHMYLSNGNDGYCLVEGTETNYTVIDCIGDWNGNPGDAGWDVAGTTGATVNHTLVRKPTVTTGNRLGRFMGVLMLMDLSGLFLVMRIGQILAHTYGSGGRISTQ